MIENENNLNEVSEAVETQQAQPVAQVVEPETAVVTEPVQETEKVEETAAPAEETAAQPEENTAVATEAGTSEEEQVDYTQLNRDELAHLLSQTVVNPDVNAIKNQVAGIRTAFIAQEKAHKQQLREAFVQAGGNAAEFAYEPDETSKLFEQAFQVYKKNRQDIADALEKQKEENLQKKRDILERMKALLEVEGTLKDISDQFNQLQEEWKEVGPIPQTEMNDTWQYYHFYQDKFYQRVNVERELRDADMKHNLELKKALCERAENLLLESNIQKAFKDLQACHAEWKEIGPVPRTENEEIWTRFKTASDQINQRRHEYYEQMAEGYKKNYEAKIVLCEQAETLLQKNRNTIKEYNDDTEVFTDMLNKWKKIGAVPQEHNEEIWQRFRKAIDAFYEAKRVYLKNLKAQRTECLNRKLDICTRAEAIKGRTDWKQATADMLALQEEWKKVGYLPEKQNEELWKRFRAACDEFFGAKETFFAGRTEAETENLNKKKAIIEEVRNLVFGENRSENLNMLKEYQQKFAEIGHVPVKEKEKVYQEFRNVIDNRFSELQATLNERRSAEYRSHIDSLVNSEEGRSALNDERKKLQNRIAKTKEDISVWENNLGFFSKSKNSELMRAEFEKKLDRAKRELASMEDRLRMLIDTTK